MLFPISACLLYTSDTTYNFDAQGKLETGLYRDWYVEGAPYCWINPVDFSLLKNHWNNLGNGQMFWFDGTGHTVKGLQRIDGESYMFCDDFTSVSYTHLDVYKRQLIQSMVLITGEPGIKKLLSEISS